MHVSTSEETLFWLIDELLVRWKAKPRRYPFSRPDAIIPQTIIPDDLRKNKEMLAVWYIAICNHMKGRVASMEAFRGNIRIWEKYPWFFIPKQALWEPRKRLLDIYDEFLPIDKKTNVRGLMINYQHLETYYGGKALNLIKGMNSYEEAERRIRNKRTKSERHTAGVAGEGFFGFQHKMVSMLVYFYDWERLFKKRFPYPSPADFHNFRIGLASKSLIVTGAKDDTIRDQERISAPWRAMVLKYIIERDVDPIDVADVLWLYSSVMCGNSPLTRTRKAELNGSGMFRQDHLPHHDDNRRFLRPNYRPALAESCLRCFLLNRCDYAIPSAPYYSAGKIVLRPRLKIEKHIDPKHLAEPTYLSDQKHPTLPFDPKPE
jgi:hypothetical protein